MVLLGLLSSPVGADPGNLLVYLLLDSGRMEFLGEASVMGRGVAFSGCEGQIKMDSPNFRTVEPSLIDQAVESWQQRRDISVLVSMPKEKCLSFVVDNICLLIERGSYEECLLHAYQVCGVNWHHCSLNFIKSLFSIADRKKLLAHGDPLPDGENYILYRGVAGTGRKRRVKGISWTANPRCAAWFAMRFVEMGVLGDPAVFTITARREDVLSYLGGKEQEFLILPQPDMKPQKVTPFPDHSSWRKMIDENSGS